MWNQSARDSGRHRPRRNRISEGIVRVWVWTRKHVFRDRRRTRPDTTTRVPSMTSNDSYLWDDPVVPMQQSTASQGVAAPQSSERREVVPRKRFQDRKLDHDHIVRVTMALNDEMKKNIQEGRKHAPEPHMPTKTSDVHKTSPT